MDTYSMHRGYSVPAVVTGKPISIGGSAGRTEATGRGVAIVAHETARHLGMSLAGARVVVQGFGNVGSIAAQTLHARGCRIVAASDSAGGVYRPEGLDPEDLIRHKQQTGSLIGYRGSDAVTNADLLELPCDILVPAAMEGQITVENAPRIKARIIVEGANEPTTPEADEILAARKVFVVPDILANAGGVIVSYFEWVQDLQSFFWSEEEINERLERIMVRSYRDVLALSEERKIEMRTGALVRAVGRVADALLTRGIYP
jgi:glutamate dehydrogenase (NAD(P)+)